MSEKTIERPDFCDDDHLHYLDELRRSGVTNMMVSPAYLRSQFFLSKNESFAIVQYWMDTFSERRARGETGD